MYVICNCYDKAPTIPVFRLASEHLSDCPAYNTSTPVGGAFWDDRVVQVKPNLGEPVSGSKSQIG